MDDIGLAEFERMSASSRISRVVDSASHPIVSTSFGIQSAVLLHMVTRVLPDIPVVFVDTGFLFPETTEFGQELAERLSLNLKIYRPTFSSEELVAKHGELWSKGDEGLAQYNQLVKVEPMNRALSELSPDLWIAGLRRVQSKGRSLKPPLEKLDGFWKAYPVIDWTDRDVYQYLKKHQLPYHPLWEKGYLSVGDTHSSSPMGAGQEEEATRFGGRKRECGLHN